MHVNKGHTAPCISNEKSVVHKIQLENRLGNFCPTLQFNVFTKVRLFETVLRISIKMSQFSIFT